jgi:hypothetical protein
MIQEILESLESGQGPLDQITVSSHAVASLGERTIAIMLAVTSAMLLLVLLKELAVRGKR